MDKDFFSSIDTRKADFAKRAGVDEAEAHVTFHGGRVVIVERIVEAADQWLLIEGAERGAEDTLIALATPYHQVASVQFVPRRVRIGRTGF